ncbi:hypothetical protein AAG570_007062 [Ranatra chinensis]|uniref:Uncharacterized protein n=1 Tax=Ranatra chinensis TaxID=642074 RepID=A0ABD0XUS5_9HEMI
MSVGKEVAKADRFGSLERRSGGGQSQRTQQPRRSANNQLSPIIEMDNPWAEQDVPNGAPKLGHEKPSRKKKKKEEEEEAAEKKKPTLGQRVRRLFARKKVDKKPEDAKTTGGDDLAARYTEYKGPQDISRHFLQHVAQHVSPAAPINKILSSDIAQEGAFCDSVTVVTSTPPMTKDIFTVESDQYAIVVPATKRAATAAREEEEDDDHRPRMDSRRSSEQSKTSWYRQDNKKTSTLRTKSRRNEDTKGYLGDKKTTSSADEDGTDCGSRLSKQLRFFGDTDVDENEPPAGRTNGGGSTATLTKKKDVGREATALRRNKSGGESSGSERGVTKGTIRISSASRHVGENSSGGESTTEGEHKSVVYLHSPAVGDVPGRSKRTGGDAGRSMEDLLAAGGGTSFRKTTVTRSASVLAPWRPQFHNSREIDYSSQRVSTLGRPPRPPSSQQHHHPKRLVFTGPSFDEKYPPSSRNNTPAPLMSAQRTTNGKTRK